MHFSEAKSRRARDEKVIERGLNDTSIANRQLCVDLYLIRKGDGHRGHTKSTGDKGVGKGLKGVRRTGKMSTHTSLVT